MELVEQVILMTNNSNVSNGQATVTIDTAGMSVGKYKVKTTYPQNNYYNSSSTSSTLIVKDWEEQVDLGATLGNWFSPPNANPPSIQVVNNIDYVKAGVNTYDANCYKIPIYRNAKTTLEFTTILYSNYGIFGLKTLKTIQGRLNDNILQYVPQWNAWSVCSTRRYSHSMVKNVPINIKLEINYGVVRIIADGLTVAENLVFSDWYDDPEFNDYFFFFIESIYSSDNVLVKDVSIRTTHLVEGTELQQVMSKYESQYTGGGN